MSSSTIKQLLHSHGLADISAAILKASQECIRLVSNDEPLQSDGLLGASKLGGKPDLDPSAIWPCRGETPLAFLLQINLGELPTCEGRGVLPETGVLSFFYDADDQAWGFDPKDKESWMVVYSPEVSVLVRRDFPAAMPNHCTFNYRPLIAIQHFCLPNWSGRQSRA
jgi:uncharacterized protein YwqG